MKRRNFIKKTLIGTTGLTLSAFPGTPLNRTAAAQPFEGTGFGWIKHCRIFIIDGYTYPLSPKIEFDAERLAETMADMHANVVRMATVSSGGWLIPGTEFKTSPALANRDLLAECIRACKPRGIKVVPYMSTGNVITTSLINPAWAQRINPQGDIPSEWDVGAKVTPVCWNTPYRQAFYDYVKTVMTRYSIDGMYFDAWLPFYSFSGSQSICYCDGCRRGFKTASGKDLPFGEGDDPYSADELKTIDQYRAWYREKLFEAFNETKRIVKSNRDIPLIYNINNPTRIIHEDKRILKGSDAFLYERGRTMIERAEGVSLAVASGLAVWPYVGTYDPFPRVPHYHFELEQEIFTSVAFGGSPILYHSYFFVDHPEAREPIREAFRVLDENDKAIKGFTPDKFCAVVWNNTNPLGHEINGWLWDTNARLSSLGAFTACLHNYIQTTSLLLQDLDDIALLNGYKVLYLPDICSLTARQIANITTFVENGGGLVMTYATSLYNENGEKLSDFALGDLAKIRHRKPDAKEAEKIAANLSFGSVTDIYLNTRAGQKVIRQPLANGLIPAHVYETVDVLDGGTVIADLVLGTDNEVLTPGIVVSHYGKGRVAYVAAAIDAMYLQTNIREFSAVMNHIIQYVSNDNVPYEIEAPQSSLLVNMTVNADQRVLHLINWTGSKNERMWQDVYYIPPIENVVVKFKTGKGKKIKNVRLFIPGEFSQKREQDILTIILRRVEKYQGVVIEMA